MKENYRLLIDTEWKDIHHSRIQEWSALGVIAAIHIGLIQLLQFIKASYNAQGLVYSLVPFFCIISIGFCILGILMTCRHRRLMWIKLNWIFDAEEKLHLIKTPKNTKGIIPLDYKMKKYSDEYIKMLKSGKKIVWNRLMWPRFLSTSGLILMFYFLLGFIDLGFMLLVIFN